MPGKYRLQQLFLSWLSHGLRWRTSCGTVARKVLKSEVRRGSFLASPISVSVAAASCCGVARARTILNLHFKSARLTDTAHRRWRQHQREPFLDLAVLTHQISAQRVCRLRGMTFPGTEFFSGRNIVAVFVWLVPVRRLKPVMANVPSTPAVFRPISDIRSSTASVRSMDAASGSCNAATRYP